MILIGIIILVIITLLNNGDKHSGETLTLSFGLIIKYFIAGMFASSAMLLPGISGSFMLLVFGAYGTVMFSISELVNLNFTALPILIIVGLGILTGFMLSSRMIQYFLHHHTTMTFALIIGFVMVQFMPFSQASLKWPSLDNLILTIIIGFIVSFTLGLITAKSDNQ